eukprot:gene13253-13361_t
MSMVISGFPEFSPKAQIVFEQVKRVIADAFSRYGYSPLETSTFERVETIQAKGMVDKEIYALRRLQAEEGEGDKDLALRFDLTVPLARYAGFKEGTDQLKAVYDATLALGVPERRLRIDLGIARGLDYYTGTVYETNLLAAPDLGKEKKIVKILISKSAAHPALDSTTEGVIDAIKAGGYREGENLEIRIENAQGNPALAAQIASKFVNQSADEGRAKLAFSTVTDPVASSVVSSLENPGNSTSGASNFVDLKPQIRLFKRIQPSLKKLGIIYNPGEINGVVIVKKLEEIAAEFDIEIVKQTISKTADVPQAASGLCERCDAIFISNDNTALAGFQSIVKACMEKKIPLYVSDTDDVEHGAVAALGPNQFKVGQKTGRLVLRALEGEDLGAIPVEFPNEEDLELFLNLDAAKNVNLDIPEDIIKSATKTFEKPVAKEKIMMMSLKNVYVTLGANTKLERNVLKGLSMEITEGEFVVLIGGNGAGKNSGISGAPVKVLRDRLVPKEELQGLRVLEELLKDRLVPVKVLRALEEELTPHQQKPFYLDSLA